MIPDIVPLFNHRLYGRRRFLDIASSVGKHPDYFLLSGGLERALYRIAREHVGPQQGGWLCRVEVLRDKTGNDAQPKEFNRMLRRVIEADQLPDYAMALAGRAGPG